MQLGCSGPNLHHHCVSWMSQMNRNGQGLLCLGCASHSAICPGLGASLEICGSDPQEADVLELLRRLPLCHFGLLEELYSPCCVPEAELSKLPRDMTEHLTPLQWGHEGRLCRQRIGLRYR